MNRVTKCCIPNSHPSISGHFPGNPIVPAVVILNEVIAICNEWQPQLRITGINNAKFVSPLRPEQQFLISLTPPVKNSMNFECTINNQTLVSGKLLTSNINN